MSFFVPFQTSFLFSSNKRTKELQFLDDFLLFLEDSGVGEIIQSEVPEYKDGRKPYNPSFLRFHVEAYSISLIHLRLHYCINTKRNQYQSFPRYYLVDYCTFPRIDLMFVGLQYICYTVEEKAVKKRKGKKE
jgi:hypothetical protein